jgi:hypothetical protein
MQQQREAFACTRDELTASISANYGNPIEQIRNEIARIDNARQEKRFRSEQYELVASALGLHSALDADTFDANRRAIAQGQSDCIGQRDACQQPADRGRRHCARTGALAWRVDRRTRVAMPAPLEYPALDAHGG